MDPTAGIPLTTGQFLCAYESFNLAFAWEMRYALSEGTYVFPRAVG